MLTIIGFNFSKLLAQQKKPAKGNLKIGTNVKIDSLERSNLVFDNDRGAVKVTFTYKVNYDPDIGTIELQGDIMFMQEKKVVDQLLKEWEEKKTVPKKVSSSLVNSIMQKCTIQAMIMTKDIGLPPPMPMPKVKSSGKNVKVDESGQAQHHTEVQKEAEDEGSGSKKSSGSQKKNK